MSWNSLMSKIYTGVGSRETPRSIIKVMEKIGEIAALNGWTLRSGNAIGPDTAFFVGCQRGNGASEIYLPWKGQVNGKSSRTIVECQVCDDAKQLASTIHPYWKNLKPTTELLLARNMYQGLGKTLDIPTRFVVCFTKDGCERWEDYSPEKTGGTGMVISLASKLEIPVYNLANDNRLEHILEIIKD